MNLDQLYDFQKEGIDFILDKKYSLLCDDVGLGKSIQSIVAARTANQPTLIICPAYLIANWHIEIQKWLGAVPCDWFIISYDKFKKNPEMLKHYEFLICDEVHALKNIKADRTIKIVDAIDKYKPSYFVGLTGTPVKNRVPDFYTLFYICYRGKFNFNYYEFCSTFCNVTEIKLRTKKYPIKKYEGVKNVDKLLDLMKPIYLRRRAKDHLNLPEKIYKPVFIPVEIKNELLEEFKAFKSGGHISTSKSATALLKSEYTFEYVMGLLEEIDKVVIFTDHVDSADKLFSLFDKKRIWSGKITGEVSMDKRTDIINDFRNANLRVLIATIGSASTGLTLTETNHMVFNDISWNYTDNFQAEGRILRIGQKNNCIYHTIFGGGLDQLIYNTVQNKHSSLTELGL